jgi:DNA (cytosine-5)-methyltransferase 1
MTKFKEWKTNDTVELLVGGTPCQSFSIAGLRKGLEDPRGNLMLTYLAMADHFKPKWLLWENVPGVLSSNGGKDFASLLQGLAELGYGFAYRVLDAQHFGVPQRRRRVFVVGCLGDWRSAAKVLFEPESLCRNITPSREKGKEIANCLTKSPSSYGSYNPARSEGNAVICADLAPTITSSGAGWSRTGNVATEPDTYVAFTTEQTPKASIDLAHTLTSSNYKHNQCVAFKVRGGCEGGGKGYLGSDELAFTLSKNQDQQIAVSCDTFNCTTQDDFTSTITTKTSHMPKVLENIKVRRLTPMECERLQGFPDNYTNTPTSSDSTRYKALGNSMAVPVMKWIGNRIQGVENGLV